MFGPIPNNLRAYSNEAVAVPHPPLRGTFPPGEGIFPAVRRFKQQFICLLCQVDMHVPLFAGGDFSGETGFKEGGGFCLTHPLTDGQEQDLLSVWHERYSNPYILIFYYTWIIGK